MALRLLTRHSRNGQLQQRPLACHPMQMQPRRALSLWRIPILLLTAKKSKRRWIVGTAVSTVLGATSLLSMVAGPTAWLAIGGAGAVVGWRVWRRTRTWWDKYMPGQINAGKRVLAALQSQADTHRDTDLLREQTIAALQRWAGTSDGQRSLLGLFRNASRYRDLTYMPTHASSMQTNGDTVHQQVEFWIEDDTTIGRPDQGCLVHATAETKHGHTRLSEIKLSGPPGTHSEMVPLDKLQTG